MKVKELITKLQEVDPEIDVLCYTEDDALLTLERRFMIFEIESTKVGKAERVRDENTQIPSLKIGEGPNQFILEVTSDF